MTLISCAYMRLDTDLKQVFCCHPFFERYTHGLAKGEPPRCEAIWRSSISGECPCKEEIIP